MAMLAMARRESTEHLLPLPAIKTVPGVGSGDPGQVKTLESYLMQVEKCVELVQKKHSKKFNKEQCDYLAGKLQVVVQSASLFLNGQCPKQQASCSRADMGRSVQIFELLLALAKQIESFVEGCCNEAWIQAAMKLTNTSEYVASLGLNLELCRVAFSNGSGAAENLMFSQVEVEEINKAVVDLVEQKALVDMKAVLAKLTSELSSLRGNNRRLSAYLLKRPLRICRDPDSFTSGPSSSGATGDGYLQIFCHLLKGKKPSGMKLGKGGFATVYKVNWQGTQVAKKTFFSKLGKENPSFLDEVKILEGLCHPNIMSMYGFEMVTNSCSIFMELMDGDLYEFMQERLEKNHDSSPFNILEAVDIMLQAGEGVNYLHSKQIVHRDLKAANILVKNVMATQSKIGYVLVKVADFGLSMIKESTTSKMTLNKGTSRWMAPEIIDLVQDSHGRPLVSEKRKYHPFKCDVYSFGMVCYEILTGDVPFGDEKLPKEVKKKVQQGDRPTLPSNCPSILRALIEKCWDKVPEQRPSLDIICLELKYLKYLLITGGTADMPVQLSSSTIVASEEAQQAFANEDILKAFAIGTNEEPLPGGTEDRPVQLSSSTIVTNEEALQALADEEALQASAIVTEVESLQNLATVTTEEALQASVIDTEEISGKFSKCLESFQNLTLWEELQASAIAIETHLRASTIVTSGLTTMQATGAQYDHVPESTSDTSSVTTHYSDASSLGILVSDVQTLIERSKLHWCNVTDLYPDSYPESTVNREIWEKLKIRYPAFFKDASDVELTLGQKISEGGQATIYEASIKDDAGKYVAKVFNLEGFTLEDILRQWPVTTQTVGNSVFKGDSALCKIMLGIFLNDGRFAFLMPREWGDLRTLINLILSDNNHQGPPFSDPQALKIMRDIAWGMSGLHSRGVLHRDLESSNILIHLHKDVSDPRLDESYSCKVADYESSVMVQGTGFWRAPEVLKELLTKPCDRKGDVWTKNSDVYSFAMTCYEILTGHIPFLGYTKPDWQRVIDGERPILPDYIDPVLQKLVKKCWRVNPSRRPSFKVLYAELEEMLEEISQSDNSGVRGEYVMMLG